MGVLAWENLQFGIQSWIFQEIISMLLEIHLDVKPNPKNWPPEVGSSY